MSTPEKLKVFGDGEGNNLRAELERVKTELAVLRAEFKEVSKRSEDNEQKIDKLRLWQAGLMAAASAIGGLISLGIMQIGKLGK